MGDFYFLTMSKLRSVSTSFWSDPFVEELTPYEKLLFLYLITNDKTNMLGIYEVSIKKISFDTGLNYSVIEKALKEFERLSKVKYIKNHIILVNFMKHQNYNTNMKKSAIDIYNELPNELKNNDLSISKDNPLKGFESLLNHYGMVSKYEVEEETEEEVEEETKKENNIEDRKLKFASTLEEFIPKYGRELIIDFYKYWTEPNKSNTKFKQEGEKTWSLERRLETWAKNELKFSKPNNSKNGTESKSNQQIFDEAMRSDIGRNFRFK